jgi:hypothetical protein
MIYTTKSWGDIYLPGLCLEQAACDAISRWTSRRRATTRVWPGAERPNRRRARNRHRELVKCLWNTLSWAWLAARVPAGSRMTIDRRGPGRHNPQAPDQAFSRNEGSSPHVYCCDGKRVVPCMHRSILALRCRQGRMGPTVGVPSAQGP